MFGGKLNKEVVRALRSMEERLEMIEAGQAEIVGSAQKLAVLLSEAKDGLESVETSEVISRLAKMLDKEARKERIVGLMKNMGSRLKGALEEIDDGLY